jgi:hypothetical protein
VLAGTLVLSLALQPAFAGRAVVGPRGGAAVEGPRGRAAVVAPRGGVAYGGHRYVRPGWNSTVIHGYARPFAAYPGWRYYGTDGLAPALAGFSSLAFLSAGVLVGSYAAQQKTVYVYVVNEDDVQKEYQVDSAGNIVSTRVVPPQ